MELLDVYKLYDIELTKALGSKAWDVNGNEYLDLYGGHAVISIGHTHPHYVNMITEQLQQIGFYSNSIKNSLQQKFADKLAELSGCKNYNLFLCNSGAEANENALKIASFINNRKKIIAFHGAFHGRTSLAVSATDNPSIRASINSMHQTDFLPLNNIELFEQTIDKSYAAVIIEGIQGVSGIHSPTTNFLKSIERKCNELGVVFIVDEVQSGYARTGNFFAHQWADINPDIITMAKGMGNGFPIAGLLVDNQFKARKEMLGTTFGGNHLACAAGCAVLDVIEQDNLITRANEMGSYLIHELLKIENIKEVRGKGLMIGIELFENGSTIRDQLLYDYKIFTGSAAHKNTIRLLPALTIDKMELNYFLDALRNILTKNLQ